MASRPLICWDIFDFFSETANWIVAKLDGKQDHNVLYQVCAFWVDQINKMATLASDWLRILDFDSKTAELNLTRFDRKQDHNALYQVFVFGLISNQQFPPWPIRQKGGTLFSGARYEALWASCLANLSKRLKGALVIFWFGSINTASTAFFIIFITIFVYLRQRRLIFHWSTNILQICQKLNYLSGTIKHSKDVKNIFKSGNVTLISMYYILPKLPLTVYHFLFWVPVF